MYRIRKDGNAINTRITAGIMVHMVSTSWALIVFVWVSFVVSISIIVYKISELMRNTIINV